MNASKSKLVSICLRITYCIVQIVRPHKSTHTDHIIFKKKEHLKMNWKFLISCHNNFCFQKYGYYVSFYCILEVHSISSIICYPTIKQNKTLQFFYIKLYNFFIFIEITLKYLIEDFEIEA